MLSSPLYVQVGDLRTVFQALVLACADSSVRQLTVAEVIDMYEHGCPQWLLNALTHALDAMHAK